jgi:alkylation response protein AidB-like acyl-CoA dehydrogenase
MTSDAVAAKAAPDLVERAAALSQSFAGRAAEHDRDATFPFENFEELRTAGLLNVTVPVEYGGLGAGLATVCRITREIARGDASTALVLNMHYMRHANIARAGRWPLNVHARICRESVDGIALINSLRVEPELGTPARGGLPATTATKTGEGWSLSGHKIYTTGSPILRYYLVWARTAGDQPWLGNFLVPASTPGCTILETWDHIGMRATGSHDVVFDNAEIPGEYAVDVHPLSAMPPPDPWEGSWNGVGIATLYHGIATPARDWLVDYLNERAPTNLGAPLATLPRMQSAVGEIQALLYANERLIDTYAAEVDAGKAGTAAQAPLIKYIATNNAIRAVDIALGLVGNPGLSRHHPLERYHRDVLCSRIHTPQDDTVTLNAGRMALGEGRR